MVIDELSGTPVRTVQELAGAMRGRSESNRPGTALGQSNRPGTALGQGSRPGTALSQSRISTAPEPDSPLNASGSFGLGLDTLASPCDFDDPLIRTDPAQLCERTTSPYEPPASETGTEAKQGQEPRELGSLTQHSKDEADLNSLPGRLESLRAQIRT
eukprot:gene24987-35431_t